MKFGIGTFETPGGYVARVVRLKAYGTEWVLSGFFQVKNVMCLHNWNMSGISSSGDNNLNLIRIIEE